MKIITKTKGIELGEDAKNYVQEKMDMLEKYLNNVDVLHCEVELGVADDKKGHRTEVNLQVKGEMIRVVKEAPALYKSIDKAKDHLARSIKRYKGKHFES